MSAFASQCLKLAKNNTVGILTIRQIALLGILADGEMHGTKEVAEAVGVQKPIISRAMDKLNHLKLAKSIPGKELGMDGRYCYLKITGQGLEFLNSLAPVEQTEGCA